MPTPIKILAYTIDELIGVARTVALENNRYVNDLFPDENPLLENFEEEVAVKGFNLKPNTIFYSLFAQGSGASFEATVDVETFIYAHRLGNTYRLVLNEMRRDHYVSCVIYREPLSQYCHSMTMRIALEHDFFAYDEKVDEEREKAVLQLAAALEQVILDKARELADSLYRRLEEDTLYRTSDEQVEEALRDWGPVFTRGGREIPQARYTPRVA